MLSGVDGKFVLNNGKHFVAALLQVRSSDEYKHFMSAGDASGDGTTSWLSVALIEVFSSGLFVDCMRMPTDDRLAHAATQCLAHETEQNRYRVSTVSDKISIARKAHTENGLDPGSHQSTSRVRFNLPVCLQGHLAVGIHEASGPDPTAVIHSVIPPLVGPASRPANSISVHSA